MFAGCRWSGGESGDVMRVGRVDGGLGQRCRRRTALKSMASTAWARRSWTSDRTALGFGFRRWMRGRGEHPRFWCWGRCYWGEHPRFWCWGFGDDLLVQWRRWRCWWCRALSGSLENLRDLDVRIGNAGTVGERGDWIGRLVLDGSEHVGSGLS